MGKSSTEQVVQNQIDPEILGWGRNNYQFAQGAAAGYQPIDAPIPSNWTDNDYRARAFGEQIAMGGPGGQPVGQETLDQAIALGMQDASYAPLAVSPFDQTLYTADPTQMYAAEAGPAETINISSINPQYGTAAQINRNNIRDVGSLGADQGISSYMGGGFGRAYTDEVVNATMGDLERQRLLQQQQNRAYAAKSGAFGGDRAAIVEGETNRGFADAAARTAAELRSRGFDTGLSAFQADQNRALQAGLANQGYDASTAGANAELAQGMGLANLGFGNQAEFTSADQYMQAALANQNAINQRDETDSQRSQEAALANMSALNNMSQFNAAAGNAFSGQVVDRDLQAQLANQQADLQGFNARRSLSDQLTALGGEQRQRALGNAAVLQQLGMDERAQRDAQAQAAYQNLLARQNVPLTQLGILQSALSMTPYNTSQTSTTTQNPSLMSNIQNGLKIGGSLMQLGGMFASDERAKKNIKPVPASKALDALNAVEYDWRDTGTHDLGLIAQDVERAIPGATMDAPSGLKHYDMPKVLGLLTAVVKDHERRIGGKRV